MPAAAIAIPAAISIGSSLLGGALGSRASNKAAKIQSEEATRQAQGFKDTLAQYNPQIGAAGEAAAADVRAAAARGGDLAIGAGTRAQDLLSPYTTLGAETSQNLRDFMAQGGEGAKTFTAADMEAYDPGYQFRLDEAQKALEKSAAARGGLLGGGTSKALAKYQQNLASSEFGAASDRFRQQQNDRYSRLFGVTQLGAQAAGQAGGYGLDAARTAGTLGLQGATSAGDFTTRATQIQGANALDTQRSIADMMTGGANARAAGTVGSANAWTGALGGIASAAQGVGKYYQDKDTTDSLSSFMNPALRYGAAPYSGGSFDPATGTYTVRR